MLRNILLSALAAASLAGCVTDYGYRGGNGGDYYYGQPRTEYRYHDPYGYYGSYEGYYYDSFGRPVYYMPYGYGYYSGPYYGYPYWYRQRPRHDDGQQTPPPTQGNDDGNDRKPPWRNLNGLVPRQRMDDGDEQRPRRMVAPMREQRMPAPQREMPMPRMRSDGGGSRTGGVIRRTKVASPEE